MMIAIKNQSKADKFIWQNGDRMIDGRVGTRKVRIKLLNINSKLLISVKILIIVLKLSHSYPNKIYLIDFCWPQYFKIRKIN